MALCADGMAMMKISRDKDENLYGCVARALRTRKSILTVNLLLRRCRITIVISAAEQVSKLYGLCRVQRFVMEKNIKLFSNTSENCVRLFYILRTALS